MVDATTSGLRRKAAWLIAVRVVIGTILLGSAIVMQITAPGALPVDPFFFLIGLTYALTIGYALTLPFVETRPWLVDVQLAGDALIVTAFIYFTGGITSYFASLYVLPVVAGSTVQFRRGGLLVATLSAVLYVGLVVAQYFAASGWLPYQWPNAYAAALLVRSVARYTVALNVFGLFAVALLSGSLADSLRSAGARLQQASTEIADLQALNQRVIDSMPSGLATTDQSYRILTFNRAAESITGVAFRSAVGQPIAAVLQLPVEAVSTIAADLRAGGARRHELRYRTPDGRGDLDIGLTATHLETPSGGFGLLFTFQDVTKIKRLERDGAIQQRLAAVGEMAAGIAHEIRNPLASMSGSIQILRQELPLSSEQEQLMDIVLRESERLNTTIRSFLAYARPQRFQIAQFDIRRALNDTALLLRNSSELGEGHDICVEVPGSELWYEADEGQIKQIVWNLATNGLRAMPHGGSLWLVAARDQASGGIVITVKDHGVGIPPEEIDALFQPFHGSFAKGSGLGLAIVHRIVKDYNGEIQVISQPGSGTSVAVRLPAGAAVTVPGGRGPRSDL
ncbi:MAG TPA: ATP-binding protein [Vicinamibacterales bacterium]|jgi:two-component system sensor histidine kinase PilS (NtrC family)|nr:ATP-binding protein [Vicinamibacterales bacterium]